MMKTVNVLLFEDFTTLDALGPAEVFSRLKKTYCASAPDRHCLRRRDYSTSNKIAWEWVTAQSEKVKWVRKARWVTDGKYYTSSGITAGIDMSLGFVSDKAGYETAREISTALEYVRNENKDEDPFSESGKK